ERGHHVVEPRDGPELAERVAVHDRAALPNLRAHVEEMRDELRIEGVDASERTREAWNARVGQRIHVGISSGSHPSPMTRLENTRNWLTANAISTIWSGEKYDRIDCLTSSERPCGFETTASVKRSTVLSCSDSELDS